LENYQWELLMAKSTKSDFKQLELVPLSTAPLSSTNRILKTEVGLYTRPVKLVGDDTAQLPTTSAKEPIASTSKPTKTETIVVTKIFGAATRQSRTPAMNRLGPRVRPTSEPTLRSRSTRSRSRSTSDNKSSAGKEEEKGEPTKKADKTESSTADKTESSTADKTGPTTDTNVMEVDLTSDPAQEDDEANQSIDDEVLMEDPDNIGERLLSPPVDSVLDKQGKEESDHDSTDEDDIRADFNEIIAEISKKFEEKLAKKREKKRKLAMSKKKVSKE
jgi:hypothetical protein